MATYSPGRIRKGLPRAVGGPAWPDVDGAVQASRSFSDETAGFDSAALRSTDDKHTSSETDDPPRPLSDQSDAIRPLSEHSESKRHETPGFDSAALRSTDETRTLRRGLPRTPGGEPWPTAGTVTVEYAVAGTAVGDHPSANVTSHETNASATTAASPAVDSSGEPDTAAGARTVETVAEERTLRRGLPRTPSGDPWPPAGTVTVERATAGFDSAPLRSTDDNRTSSETSDPSRSLSDESEATRPLSEHSESKRHETAGFDSAPLRSTDDNPTSSSTDETRSEVPAKHSPAEPTATDAPSSRAASASPPATKAKPAREPIRIGSRALAQWVKLVVLWGLGAIGAAGIIVLAARGVTTLPGVPEFVNRYPGAYDVPEFVEPGFPAWARWTHYLNFFFMVLIVRTGLLVRMQQKPDAYYTPKKGGKKVSIYLWLHTSIDILWLVNGAVFVVMLFATGHWARIVPTSWEVFPNALSAMLQYLTLEFPHVDGWVNYNSLQQLMYFTVVFIAAPLAALTGVRMSEWWPEDSPKLNTAFPAPVARAIHFPVMLFFVLFVIVHVFLVFVSGALKNLNHMFAGTTEISWTGFWWFAGGLLLVAAVTWAARPLVIAPIANLFGRVSER